MATGFGERTTIFFPANVSESTKDRAVDPKSHKHRLRRLLPHNKCQMEIASTASDGIENRLDEHRQKELESQDRRGLNRESNCQRRLRTIQNCAPVSRSSAASSSITTVMIQSFVDEF